jgi:8-oxo-dGTP pyrophosphatase MutT (NUDIX family)
MNPGDELVDVIDEAGRTVGVVPRREMRTKRLPHRCTYLLVYNGRGELFIHQRTAAKDVYPSYWDVAVGGVLAAGEDYDAGAVREAREEIGVDVEPERLFLFRYSDERSIAQGMVYRATHNGPFRLQPEEIVRGEFVPPYEVLRRAESDPFCPDGLAVLMEYRKRGRMPFVYTVGATFTEQAVADEWLAWLNGGHIAEVLAGGACDAEIVALEGATIAYEVRYHFPSRHAFAVYERDHAPRLRAEGLRLFPPERGVTYRRGTGIALNIHRPML